MWSRLHLSCGTLAPLGTHCQSATQSSLTPAQTGPPSAASQPEGTSIQQAVHSSSQHRRRPGAYPGPIPGTGVANIASRPQHASHWARTLGERSRCARSVGAHTAGAARRRGCTQSSRATASTGPPSTASGSSAWTCCSAASGVAPSSRWTRRKPGAWAPPGNVRRAALRACVGCPTLQLCSHRAHRARRLPADVAGCALLDVCVVRGCACRPVVVRCPPAWARSGKHGTWRAWAGCMKRNFWSPLGSWAACVAPTCSICGRASLSACTLAGGGGCCHTAPERHIRPGHPAGAVQTRLDAVLCEIEQAAATVQGTAFTAGRAAADVADPWTHGGASEAPAAAQGGTSTIRRAAAGAARR